MDLDNNRNFDTIRRICYPDRELTDEPNLTGGAFDIPPHHIPLLVHSFLTITYGDLFGGKKIYVKDEVNIGTILFTSYREDWEVLMTIGKSDIGRVNVKNKTAHVYRGNDRGHLVENIACDSMSKSFEGLMEGGDSYLASKRQEKIAEKEEDLLRLELEKATTEVLKLAVDPSKRKDLKSVFINAPNYQNNKILSLDESGKKYEAKSKISTSKEEKQWYEKVSKLAHFKADCLRVVDGYAPTTKGGINVAKFRINRGTVLPAFEDLFKPPI